MSSQCADRQPEVAFKSTPLDFQVEEQLPVEFSGEGEHGCFYVEKRGRNTTDVAAALARATGCAPLDVGYCGRKDKHAVTRQWFSVRGTFDWPDLADPAVQCLRQARHRQKLRRGMHSANHFRIVLRQCPADISARLEPLADGFANYFGPQRVNAANCAAARCWLQQRRVGPATRPRRRQRRPAVDGWQLSVLRSELFNAVLARRAGMAGFPAALDGDVLVDGFPTGPLWGRGRSAATGTALALEQDALAPFADICEQLEYTGVSQARRALWLQPRDFTVTASGTDCTVAFSLPPGAYATALLGQAVNLVEPARG